MGTQCSPNNTNGFRERLKDRLKERGKYERCATIPNGATIYHQAKEKYLQKNMATWTYLKLLVIKVFLILYDIVTLPIYFLIQQPWRKWRSSRTVWAKPVREGDPYSPIVRIMRSCVNPLEGISTLDELFRMAVIKHGNKKFLGFREVLAESEEYYKTGKVFKRLRLRDYHWYSYIEVANMVEALSKGLLAVGFQPKKQIVMFAETRIEWMLLAQACFRINVPVATIYATLGEDGVIYGINETEVTSIITSQDLLPKLKKIIDKIPAVNQIIYMEDIKPIDTSEFPERISILRYSEVQHVGKTTEIVNKVEPPSPNDLAILMYTSGSAGVPKGVLLTHKNMVTTSAGLLDAIPVLRKDDVYIAYLPLAHAYEICAECFFFVMGVAVGYSSPHTITDKSTAVMTGCKGDTSLLQPTILTTVPLMLDRIRKSVNEVIATKGPFAKEFFSFAIRYKQFWCQRGFNTPILNRLVFRNIQQLLGGKVRIVACGSAPLSTDTNGFVRACLDVKLVQAYGMTETAGTGTIMSLDDFSMGRVGAPLSSCYIKLADWAEGGYRATDKPNPRGEIVIGGECVTLGYLKNETLTKEAYKEEDGIRWFYTGDIGELYPDGTFKIIDRKKDLVKLQHGEYVSLGKVEAEMKTCPVVDNICVVGNSFHDHLIGLVVPNVQQLQTLASTLGKENLALHELCQDESLSIALRKVLMTHGQKSGLSRQEIPTNYKLCAEEWHPETGLVTAAFKIRRRVIEQFYNEVINQAYCSNGTVVNSTEL